MDLAKVARGTAGFTGADLENLSNEAALLCARRGAQFITMADFEEAEIKVLAGPEKRSRVVPEHERKLTAYHEAGHAVVMHALPDQDPVTQITIVPRGQAGGMTISLPTEDKAYLSKKELEERIAVCLGGRAAEQLALGDISTGAGNDLQKASAIARNMVTRYGMSDEFDMVALETVNNQYLGGDTSLACSAQTQREIDQKVVELVKTQHEKAIRILTENRAKLDELAQYLYQKETITGEEFMDILNRDNAENKPENP